jgi:hypothetical protein
MEERTKMLTDDRSLDSELRRQLDVIRSEETPERLLVLARELQDLLRERGKK